MRHSPEQQHYPNDLENGTDKPSRSVLEKVRSKLLAGTLVAGSLFGAGSIIEQPLEAQQQVTYKHTVAKEVKGGIVGEQDRVERMHRVANILSKSQPAEVEQELIQYFGADVIAWEKDPNRFSPEHQESRETRLPEQIPFKGGVITRSQLKEYMKTLPAAWENAMDAIEYSEAEPVGVNGLKIAAKVKGRKTIVFYKSNSESSSPEFVLETAGHEIAHKAVGKYIDYLANNPGGSAELSQRVLYALMQRLKAPDRFNGGDQAEYLKALSEKPELNFRLASEYLAVIAAQYIEDPRQLPKDDFHLVAMLIAIENEHFDMAGSFNKRAALLSSIKSSNRF